ncbi:MAG TPA: DUF3034 family protein [Myxococcota bacterium]|nr:DUF3034 family protein [Myxococcota bacterium]
MADRSRPNRRMRSTCACLLALAVSASGSAAWAGGRLLATDGATQIEGSAGSGIVPWAVITGMGTEDEIGGSAFATGVFVDDLQLVSVGAAVGLFDRVELSFAHQRLEVRPLDEVIRQNVFGVKVRVVGDHVYGRIPAIAVGAQFKHVLDFEIPEAIGADDDWGVDLYAGATKLFLGAAFGHHVLVSADVRASKANELGLLGFGGPGRDNYQFHFEGALALFLTRRIALGYDFRHKTSLLRTVDEDPWHDVFLAVVPSRNLKLVAAYGRFGEVAGLGHQDGGYISIQGSF